MLITENMDISEKYKEEKASAIIEKKNLNISFFTSMELSFSSFIPFIGKRSLNVFMIISN